jgi:M6 family metalloprotease-like protein
LGKIRIGVVFVDFPDAIATRSTESVLSIVSPAAEDRFAHLSYGKADFDLLPVHKWIRMNNDSASYEMSRQTNTFSAHRRYVSEALDHARTDLDVRLLDGFLVIANPDAKAIDFGPAFTPNDRAWAEYGSGYRLMNGATSGTDLLSFRSGWFNHEFGHALGLVDLYAFRGSTHRFVGYFSLMGWISPNGEGAPELFGWERWSLGWLDDSQVACLTRGSATVELEPIEQKGGMKILVVPVSTNRAVVVEARRRIGYDTGLLKEGALLYVVDTSIQTGEGPIRVLPINEADTYKMNVPLSVGASFEYEGVRIRVDSSNQAGDRVTVSYGK